VILPSKTGIELPMSSLDLREVRDMVYANRKFSCRVWHEHCVPDLKRRSFLEMIGVGKRV
jgi:hypothetical protein